MKWFLLDTCAAPSSQKKTNNAASASSSALKDTFLGMECWLM